MEATTWQRSVCCAETGYRTGHARRVWSNGRRPCGMLRKAKRPPRRNTTRCWQATAAPAAPGAGSKNSTRRCCAGEGKSPFTPGCDSHRIDSRNLDFILLLQMAAHDARQLAGDCSMLDLDPMQKTCVQGLIKQHVTIYPGGDGVREMSGLMEKETFQRLTLLYLIGQFPKGVYSSFRLQKVLYYATRDVDPKPFTFHHTNYGQYSHGAAAQLTLMLEGELVTQKSLPGNREGSHWQLSDMIDTDAINRSLEHGFPNLAQAIKKSVKDHGFQKQRDLDVNVHQDTVLEENPLGSTLLEECSSKLILSKLDQDEAEDLEMLLSPEFLRALKFLSKTLS